MKISKICVTGFTNVAHAQIELSGMNALIAPNGYGKSNVLKALEFGASMIAGTPAQRERLLQNEAYQPVNMHNFHMPYRLEVEGTVLLQDEEMMFCYGFSADWERKIITEEVLKVKRLTEQRYRSLILREASESFVYLPSAGQRCNKQVAIGSLDLAVVLLATNEKLFYKPLLEVVAALQIPRLESLENPDYYFSTDRNHTVDFLGGRTVNEYIYRLMVERPDDYALLQDGILSLNRNLESFTPVEAKLGEGIDNTVYDIRIKDKHIAQETSISRISAGSKRIIFLFTIAMTANMCGIPLLLLEEPENSVHPKLMENLLLLLGSYAEDTKVLLTSHSPYLMRYMNSRNLWFGLPNEEGLAHFAQLKEKKRKLVHRCASEMELTVGEYMFDFMLDIEDRPEKVEDFFEV